MADQTTTRYLFVKPEVGASADTWGSKLNTVLDNIDLINSAITTGGSGAAYTLTTGITSLAYVSGQSFVFKASFTCNAAATLNVDSLGAKNITKHGTTATVSGDIVSGHVYKVVYDGTQFQVESLHKAMADLLYQPLDATLTALAALTISADSYIRGTGADAFSVDTVLRPAAGSAGTPAYSFASDLNTGIFGDGIDTLRFSTGGSERWQINAGGSLFPGGASRLFFNNGSAALPSLSALADQDNGFYYIGTDNWGRSAGGTLRADINTTRELYAVDIVLPTAGPTDILSAGFRGAPLGNSAAAITADYTLVLADAGKTILHNSGSTHTVTIPANASVAYPIGTTIIIDNAGGNSGAPGALTIAITSDTLYRGDGVSGTGSRTLAANGVAAVRKVTSTAWVITGSGIT